MIRLDPDEFVNLRKIEFRSSQRNHPFAQQLKLVDRESRMRDDSHEATFYGFMVEEGAPPRCSKFDDVAEEAGNGEEETGLRAKKKRKSQSPGVEGGPLLPRNGSYATSSSARIAERIAPRLSSPVLGSTFARTHSAPIHPAPKPDRSVSELAAAAAARRIGGATEKTSSLSALPEPPKQVRRAVPRLSSHVPIHNPLASPDDSTSQTPINVPDFDPSSAIIYPAGTYEIVLVVDSREIESRSSRDKITETLLSKGVKVETRALRLGDMCWIARRIDGMGGEEDECVLDYVVERKRLDDLCSSIKDGRYTEQCVSVTNE